jgi:REP element-mobilizing transposase RayT
MSHNLVCCCIHLVWSTRNQQRLIPEPVQPRLWAYMHATAETLGLRSFAFGGIADHVHGLVGLSATVKISDMVQQLKATSSRWMHEEFKIDFAWQKNYCVHSVSVSQILPTTNYIRNQPQHHVRHDFRKEMRLLLQQLGIPDQDALV